MLSLPSVLGHLTLAELEQRFAGGKVDAGQANSTVPTYKIEVITALAEVATPIEGCEGANFFEPVPAGVTVFTSENV